MKKFNKSIKVEVSIDTIAQQLLEAIKDDFKHKEVVVENIIGFLNEAPNKNGISTLYNNLNGHVDTIDFKVGEKILCDSKAYSYARNSDNELKQVYGIIGKCSIVEINEYSTHQLLVEFDNVNRKGETTKAKEWVLISNCKTIQIP